MGHQLSHAGCVYYNDKRSTCMNKKSSWYNKQCTEKCQLYISVDDEKKENKETVMPLE